MKLPFELKLAEENDALIVTVRNISEHNQRLWERENSWGWSMFSLLVHSCENKSWQEYFVKKVRHTRNVPRTQEVTVGGQVQYEFRAQDPAWQDFEQIDNVSDDELLIRVKLHIACTRESSEENVPEGETISPIYISSAPRRWLTGADTPEARKS